MTEAQKPSFRDHITNTVIGAGCLATVTFPVWSVLFIAAVERAKDARHVEASSVNSISVGDKALLLNGRGILKGELIVRTSPDLLPGTLTNTKRNGGRGLVDASVQNPLFFTSRNPNNGEGVVGWWGYIAASTGSPVYIGYSETQRQNIKLLAENGELLNPQSRKPIDDINELVQNGLLKPVTITSAGIPPSNKFGRYTITAVNQDGTPINIPIAVGTNPKQ